MFQLIDIKKELNITQLRDKLEYLKLSHNLSFNNPMLPNQLFNNPMLPNQLFNNPMLPNQSFNNPMFPNLLFINPMLPNLLSKVLLNLFIKLQSAMLNLLSHNKSNL
jgi:hypothetical protein